MDHQQPRRETGLDNSPPKVLLRRRQLHRIRQREEAEGRRQRGGQMAHGLQEPFSVGEWGDEVVGAEPLMGGIVTNAVQDRPQLSD
jgi:hypothetical protein